MNIIKRVNDWTDRKPVLARNVTVIVCCFGAIWSVAAIPTIGLFSGGFAAGVLLMGRVRNSQPSREKQMKGETDYV